MKELTIEQLEKALDKACELLVYMKRRGAGCWEIEDKCPFRDICTGGTDYCYTESCWKEYLLQTVNRF